jgi:hypothetical protein
MPQTRLDTSKPKTLGDYMKSSVLFLVTVGLAVLLVFQIWIMAKTSTTTVYPPTEVSYDDTTDDAAQDATDAQTEDDQAAADAQAAEEQS